MIKTMELKEAARYLVSLGINCLPTKVKEKRPFSRGSWSEFQSRMITNEEIERLFTPDINGIGVITGAISGNLECVDIDNKLNNADEILDLFIEEENVYEILMSKCLIEKTQSGGFHIIYRAEEIENNRKLAMMKDNVGNYICVIETRGEGGFLVVNPSPGYEIRYGRWEGLQLLSKEEREILVSFAQSLNQELAFEEFNEDSYKESKYLIRPGDAYNSSNEGINEAKSILVSMGWQLVKITKDNVEYWRRPGAKTKRHDATFRDNVFYVFSTNAHPFKNDHAYKPFSILILAKFDGNVREAVKYLIEKGYGKIKQIEDRPNRSDDSEKFYKVVIRGKQVSLRIDMNNFKNFLKTNGFGKIYVGKEVVFIRKTNNIIEEVTPVMFKDFIQSYINELEEPVAGDFTRADLKNLIFEKNKELFSQNFLEFLDTLDLKIVRDIRDEAYFFFKNCWVRVNESGYQMLDYSKLNGVIWKRQIIPRDFEIVDFNGCDFEMFIRNICRNEEDRYLSLKTAIGYLLHTYKDPANAKAIIFCDEGEVTSEYPDANGRTGKSLVGKAIGKLRNECRIDGRNFKIDKTFAFQSVNLDTQFIHFNDVPKKFDFEKLFSIITDAITVEKKNRDEFIIPFEYSPKILISTNYTIQVDGTSGKDRKFEVEFSNFYNINHRPVDDFEYRFFDDWVDNKEYEWKKFDNYMISCVITYLQNGLMPYKFRNLLRKQITEGSAPEFYDFMQKVERDIPHKVKELLDKFLEEYPDFKDKVNQDRFGRWISNYVLTTGIKAERVRVNNQRGWKFYSDENIFNY